MGKHEYDLTIIGGGAAGFVSAKMARGFGKTVALIEKGRLGGECTNFGCVPSKALIRVARAAHELKSIEKFGLKLASPASVNTDGVMAHVRSIVEKVYRTHLPESFRSQGIDLYFGSPQFKDNHTVAVEDRSLSSDRVIVSTGSSPTVPPIAGLSETPYLTNNTVFSLEKLPRSLIVLGGGPIGVELSAAFNRLGVETTVVEMLERILFREDKEMAELIASRLQAEGLKIVPSAKVKKISHSCGKITMLLESGREIVSDSLLVATGRKPNTGGLDLERGGVQHGADGIQVNDLLQTTADNIFACGDVTGPYRFSHMSEYQGIIACRNAFLPFKRRVDYRNVIWATFTDPELAHAGLTEDEAREIHGDTIQVIRYEYGKTDRARTDIEEFGLCKVILDRRGNLLGAHILGAHASEVIHEVQLAKYFKIPFERIWEPIHIYPSYSDVVRQPSKYYYGDTLNSRFLIKLLKKLF